jgi:hypothetical protein
MRREYPPEFADGHFSLAYGVGPDSVPALQPFGRTLNRKLAFYYHESFHAFQERRFAPSPQGDRRVRFRERLADSAITESSAFAGAAEHERRILAHALATDDQDSVRALLHQYLRSRSARLAKAPDIHPIERSFERREGTATFVGYHAATLAIGGSDDDLRSVLREELVKPLAEFSAAPEADARQMRWRLYGTGAAICYFLEQMVPDWKGKVENGSYVDAILATALGYPSLAAVDRVPHPAGAWHGSAW